MTTEELILGHFDESLTPAEEHQLQELLGHSPEARSLFEQHGALQRMLSSDVGTLAPSSSLDEAAIAAALGAAPEVMGGGAAAGWLSGKVAAAVALVAAGGISIALFSSSGSKAPSPSPSPAVAPAQQQIVAPSSAPITHEPAPITDEAPPSTHEVAAPTVAPPAGKPAQREKLAARTNDASSRPVVKKSRSSRAQRRLSIDTEGTTIHHPPQASGTSGR